MAKKVKFPLKMADDARVSSLEELREHFDLESVLGYYASGRLMEWLEDRYYDEEAERIGTLDSSAPGFQKELCKALGVEYAADEADDLDMEEIAARNERRERLKTITADETILAAADRVAFTQEDLANLLDNDVKEIYLCTGPFKIPGRVENVIYIGVDHPKADPPKEFASKGIVFKNVDVAIDDIIRQAKEAPDEEDATLWLMAAELGNAEAQYMVGCRYWYGDSNVEQSDEEAVRWFRKAVEQGYAPAQDALGDCYSNGDGVKQSFEEAVKWYRKAAEQGYDWAQNNLANCYYNGKGVEQDYEKAVKWYRKAAVQSNAEAQKSMGFFFYYGIAVERDYAEAAKWYRKAAEQGNTEAQEELGECYYRGEGVERDYSEAAKWFLKAWNASAEYSRGFIERTGSMLASCYDEEKNYAEAVKWYRKLAEQGYDSGAEKLGNCYYNGKGVEQDYSEAVKWYLKAWNASSFHIPDFIARVGYVLGNCYYNGNGVEQDYEEAIKWYRKAAEQGNEEAQSNLNRCYEEKYREEAEQGDEEAKYTLGFRYANGDGVEEDPEEAAKWYRKAAEGYGEFAIKAQLELGYYLCGRGNDAEANKWFRKVAASGIEDLATEAQWRIGQSFCNGTITEEEAKKWYRQAMNGVEPFASKARDSLKTMGALKTMNRIFGN